MYEDLSKSGRLVGTYDTSHYAYGVAVSGNHAYVADAYGGLLVIDISNPYIPRLVGSEPTPGLAWHVVVSGTLAFVASGVAGGLAIFDISNPARPVLVASQDTPGSAYGIFLANTLIFIADLDGGLLILEYLDALPNLGLELNHRAFGHGQELTLAANVIPGLMPVLADVYVAVQLPDGSLLFLQGDGSFTTEIRPIVTGWSVAPFSGEIFRYIFSGGEPAGNYTWLAAFTQLGTLSFVGPIVSAPFSFSP